MGDIIVKFRGRNMILEWQYYANGGPAIRLLTEEYEPYCTATVWIPDIPEKHVAIKDYAENEGVLAALIRAGIVGQPVEWRQSGWVMIPICKLGG